MKFNQKQNNKKTQYIIGSIVAICVLFLWISIPMMSNSPLDSSVPVGGFSKKSADLSLLDSAGVDAPGSPLTGELIDNPATSLELSASALFSSNDDENTSQASSTSEAENSDNNSNTAPAPAPEGSASSYGGPKAKLQVLPSLTSGNSGSQTVGSTHNKFFGSNQPKAEFLPQQSDKLDVKPKSEKALALFAALKNAEEKSLQAAQAKDLAESRNSATTAFENSKKTNESLTGKDEQSWSEAAGELGKINQDLKKNDPSLNKYKVTPPAPPKKELDQEKFEEQLKQWLLQMILQATVGQVFGAMGQMIAMTINPNYIPSGSSTHSSTTKK